MAATDKQSEIKKIITDLKQLTTKVENSNKNETKDLHKTKQVLDACRMNIENLYNENVELKKKNEKSEIINRLKRQQQQQQQQLKENKKIKLS